MLKLGSSIDLSSVAHSEPESCIEVYFDDARKIMSRVLRKEMSLGDAAKVLEKGYSERKESLIMLDSDSVYDALHDNGWVGICPIDCETHPMIPKREKYYSGFRAYKPRAKKDA